VRPGREHDLTAANADPHLLELIALCVSDGQMSLAGLAYEGEPETFKVPFKKPKGGQLSVGCPREDRIDSTHELTRS
jgi:hypothetical protein